MKTGIWFEPYRAMPGTRLATEHPEWVGTNGQVKLEIPAARQWVFNAMCSIIDQAGAKWIRCDYNQEDPLSSWNARDTADTQGLTQIRCLQGEYQLLDQLRTKYPDMVIESCAGGGRRIDLETISRAHTFCKSDNPGNMILTRSQATGANYFLPGGLLNGTNLGDYPDFGITSNKTTFDLRSMFAGPIGCSFDCTQLDTAARDRVKQAIAEFTQVRHLLNKDYYPLFQQTLDDAQWNGWEFYDPETREGFLTVLRPEKSTVASAVIQLGGLDMDKMYELSRIDGSQSRKVLGKELLNGLTISLDAGGSEVLRFHAVPEPSTVVMTGCCLLSLFVRKLLL
jgi:alpha-galactosidase